MLVFTISISGSKMDDKNDRTGLLGGESSRNSPSTPDTQPLYNSSEQSTTTRLMHLAFVCVVVALVVITFVLSIYRSAVVVANKGLHVMLGLSLLSFLALEVILVIFLKRGDIPRDKAWFLYAVGGAILLESIFTNVLLFDG